VEHKLERVQEKLVEAWPEIRKVAPQLPESSAAGEPEHQIELLQGAWSQLAIHAENLEVQLWESQQEAEQQPQNPCPLAGSAKTPCPLSRECYNALWPTLREHRAIEKIMGQIPLISEDN
jgi:hypothetical protein